eukprot:365768-Chlamydomonas_euryale.AAC.8
MDGQGWMHGRVWVLGCPKGRSAPSFSPTCATDATVRSSQACITDATERSSQALGVRACRDYHTLQATKTLAPCFRLDSERLA